MNAIVYTNDGRVLFYSGVSAVERNSFDYDAEVRVIGYSSLELATFSEGVVVKVEMFRGSE